MQTLNLDSNHRQFVEIGGVNPSTLYFERNYWIEKSTSEINKMRKKFNNTDVFKTTWTYENKDPKSLMYGPLYFDIDNEDLNQSIIDTKTLINILTKTYLIPLSCLRIRFSGNKGFHVLIPNLDLPLYIDRPKLWKAFANFLNDYIGSIDVKVYDRRRLFRLLNSKHSKTGLYKIPLYLSEMVCKEAVKELAKQPRKIEEINASHPKSAFIDKLLEFNNTLTKDKTAYKKPPCIQKIEQGVGDGSRNSAMYTIAIYYKNLGLTEEKVSNKILEWNEKNTPRIESNEIDKTIRSVFSNDYGIGCSTPELKEFCNKDECPIYRSK